MKNQTTIFFIQILFIQILNVIIQLVNLFYLTKISPEFSLIVSFVSLFVSFFIAADAAFAAAVAAAAFAVAAFAAAVAADNKNKLLKKRKRK